MNRSCLRQNGGLFELLFIKSSGRKKSAPADKYYSGALWCIMTNTLVDAKQVGSLGKVSGRAGTIT